MAYVDGFSLKEKIQTGPLAIDEVISISRQICDGLQSAHDSGIVHRDIKSANIMVNEKGLVKIMDFGLAKLAGQTQVTKTGVTLGTAAYMSPEQAQGRPVDQRTDIWALGVVMYEMLTGTLPFKGDYELAVMYSIINENPADMTAVPAEFAGILARCLKKNPAERYPSMTELLADLSNDSAIILLEKTVKELPDDPRFHSSRGIVLADTCKRRGHSAIT